MSALSYLPATTFCVLGLAFALVGICLLFQKHCSARRQYVVCVMASSSMVAATSLVFSETPPLFLVGLSIAVPLALVLVRSEFLSEWLRKAGKIVRKPGFAAAALLLSGSALIALAVMRSEPVQNELFDENYTRCMLSAPPAFLEIEELQAMTDRGRRIPLMQSENMNAENVAQSEEFMLKDYCVANLLIRLTTPIKNVNCHGWIFTQGGYWIRGTEVDPILVDNNYQLVATPQPGDIAIYRDDNEGIIHSGIVRGFRSSSDILVESKWGNLGVYLHFAGNTPYGNNVQYFHTSRQGGHVLAGTPLQAPRERINARVGKLSRTVSHSPNRSLSE